MLHRARYQLGEDVRFGEADGSTLSITRIPMVAICIVIQFPEISLASTSTLTTATASGAIPLGGQDDGTAVNPPRRPPVGRNEARRWTVGRPVNRAGFVTDNSAAMEPTAERWDDLDRAAASEGG